MDRDNILADIKNRPLKGRRFSQRGPASTKLKIGPPKRERIPYARLFLSRFFSILNGSLSVMINKFFSYSEHQIFITKFFKIFRIGRLTDLS